MSCTCTVKDSVRLWCPECLTPKPPPPVTGHPTRDFTAFRRFVDDLDAGCDMKKWSVDQAWTRVRAALDATACADPDHPKPGDRVSLMRKLREREEKPYVRPY